ncbi:MAG: hypothetical protein Q3976_10235 [Corynebacterium sp.]|nr:hypothetical protein [Corynebacterium sp.]
MGSGVNHKWRSVGRHVITCALTGALVAQVVVPVNQGWLPSASADVTYPYTYYIQDNFTEGETIPEFYVIRLDDATNTQIPVTNNGSTFSVSVPASGYYRLYALYPGVGRGMAVGKDVWIGPNYTSSTLSLYNLRNYQWRAYKIVYSPWGNWWYSEQGHRNADHFIFTTPNHPLWQHVTWDALEVLSTTGERYWSLMREAVLFVNPSAAGLMGPIEGGHNNVITASSSNGVIAFSSIRNALGLDQNNAQTEKTRKALPSVFQSLIKYNPTKYGYLQYYLDNPSSLSTLIETLVNPSSNAHLEETLEIAQSQPQTFNVADARGEDYFKFYKQLPTSGTGSNLRKIADDYETGMIALAKYKQDSGASMTNEETLALKDLVANKKAYEDSKSGADAQAGTLAKAAVANAKASNADSALYSKLVDVPSISAAYEALNNFSTVEAPYAQAVSAAEGASTAAKALPEYTALKKIIDSPYTGNNGSAYSASEILQAISDYQSAVAALPAEEPETTSPTTSEEAPVVAPDPEPEPEPTSEEGTSEESTSEQPTSQPEQPESPEPVTPSTPQTPPPSSEQPQPPAEVQKSNLGELQVAMRFASQTVDRYADVRPTRTLRQLQDLQIDAFAMTTETPQAQVDAATRELIDLMVKYAVESESARIDRSTDDENGLFTETGAYYKSQFSGIVPSQTDYQSQLATINQIDGTVNVMLTSLKRLRVTYQQVAAVTSTRIYKYSTNRAAVDESIAAMAKILDDKNVTSTTPILQAMTNYFIAQNRLDGETAYTRAMSDLNVEVRMYSNTVYSSRYQNDILERRNEYRNRYGEAKDFFEAASADPTQSYPESLAQIQQYTEHLRAARLALKGLSDIEVARERLRTAILINSLIQTNMNDAQKAAIERALAAVQNDGDLRTLEQTVVTIAREQNLLKDTVTDETVTKSARYVYAPEEARKAYDEAVASGKALLRDKSDIDGWDDVVQARLAIARAAEALRGSSPYAGELEALINASYDIVNGIKYTGSNSDKRLAYMVGINVGRFVLADPDTTAADLESAVSGIKTSYNSLDGDLPRKIIIGGAAGSAAIVLLGYLISLILKQQK